MLGLLTDCTCASDVVEIDNLSESMNSDSKAETGIETRLKTVTFSNTLHCLETVKTYLMQQDVNDAVFSSMHLIEKLFLVRNRKDCEHLLVSILKFPINWCLIIA
ncbi:hypothetical protein TNCV_626091 [Trichonephila clavipes]|nr:hypothetical protein TNCV_626091 [Trichonephila clavipes]